MKIIDDISNFIFLQHKLEKADIIFIPGSSFGDLAVKAAELYNNHFADKILPSGKYSILKDSFACDDKDTNKSFLTECEYLNSILIKHGVNKYDILKENTAQNTYENSLRSKEVVHENNITVKKAIIVCKSYHARRCYMYYSLAFPDAELFICPVDFENITKNNWFKNEKGIDTVLGEIERCGWQFNKILKNLFC